MAVGNVIARVLLAGSRVLGRTFVEAWKEAGKKAAQQPKRKVISQAGNITAEEAKAILGLDGKAEIKHEDVLKQYEYLFKANDRSQGGSVYLQAKVASAKVKLEEEFITDEPEEILEKEEPK